MSQQCHAVPCSVSLSPAADSWHRAPHATPSRPNRPRLSAQALPLWAARRRFLTGVYLTRQVTDTRPSAPRPTLQCVTHALRGGRGASRHAPCRRNPQRRVLHGKVARLHGALPWRGTPRPAPTYPTTAHCRTHTPCSRVSELPFPGAGASGHALDPPCPGAWFSVPHTLYSGALVVPDPRPAQYVTHALRGGRVSIAARTLLCSCVHVRLCSCVHVRPCLCMHVRLCSCVHVCLCSCSMLASAHACMFASAHACMFACAHACISSSAHACMFAPANACMLASAHACSPSANACMFAPAHAWRTSHITRCSVTIKYSLGHNHMAAFTPCTRAYVSRLALAPPLPLLKPRLIPAQA